MIEEIMMAMWLWQGGPLIDRYLRGVGGIVDRRYRPVVAAGFSKK